MNVCPSGAQDESSSVTMVPVSGGFGLAMALQIALTSLMRQKSSANPSDVVLHSLNVVMEHV